ncbi:type IV pilus biogenesis protein EbsA [Gloeothece verrucosa]|uniref:Uncharacterized protein n=1 Tax=Gloeothece verrucosa (strain PCC 7822) TaxID=497965 RepID=E0UEJ3_GLOV7|nr:type IV pilus biogenesis protein EbsA [Gloeothece verrucosa]ADN16561.1 conserved hypothetical protein [Gloeothece verrucosa PCC 7822]
MSSIDKLEPASKGDVVVYMPYYPKDKHSLLPYAITLYQQGYLEGQRQIEGSDNIPFVASWYVSKLPSELTRCRIQFEGQAELSYEMTVLNAEFIDYLIDVIKVFKQLGAGDFPQGFYRKLLRFEEQPT